MTAPLPASRRQFLVSVTGIPDFWAAKAGGVTTSATTDVYNGGQVRPVKLAAAPVTANVTLTRPFVPQRDVPWLKQLSPLIGKWRSTISVQPTDPDLVPLGGGAAPDVYASALLVGITPPEPDASSGAEATVVLEFAVAQIS